jgi:hypothetical protein
MQHACCVVQHGICKPHKSLKGCNACCCACTAACMLCFVQHGICKLHTQFAGCDVAMWPHGPSPHLCHVCRLHDAWQLLRHPQQPLLQLPARLEALQVKHHVLTQFSRRDGTQQESSDTGALRHIPFHERQMTRHISNMSRSIRATMHGRHSRLVTRCSCGQLFNVRICNSCPNASTP